MLRRFVSLAWWLPLGPLVWAACAAPPRSTIVDTDPGGSHPPAAAPGAPPAPRVDGGKASGEGSGTPAIVERARSYLGAPYRYGGTNPSRGFDCSGLVHRVFLEEGLAVPRTAAQQFRAARTIPLALARPGDLVFFGKGTSVTHVGIYVGGASFIHASTGRGRVRIDRLDRGYFDRRFVAAGRIAPGGLAR